jgi:hypothetical protein
MTPARRTPSPLATLVAARSRMRSASFIVVSYLLCGAACSDGSPPTAATAAIAPALRSGTDSADRSCQVVLRSIQRMPAASNGNGSGGDGYETDCSSGTCLDVWRGVVEVADSLSHSDTTVVPDAVPATPRLEHPARRRPRLLTCVRSRFWHGAFESLRCNPRNHTAGAA